jgi:hypothetical protein
VAKDLEIVKGNLKEQDPGGYSYVYGISYQAIFDHFKSFM